MSYILLLSSVIFLSPITKKRETKNIITLFYIFLLFFACTRFGIGTDYFSYYNIFSGLPASFNNLTLLKLASYGIEPGFSLLIILFKRLNLSYVQFVAFCSFIPLTLIFFIIQKHSINKTVSLFIFLANYYAVYIENLVRQGIAMSIFIYAILYLISTKKTINFLIIILIGTTFHVSLIIALIVPVILKFNRKLFLNIYSIILLSIIAFAAGIVFFRSIVSIIPRVNDYASWGSNYFAIIIRTLNIILILYIYTRVKNNLSRTEISLLKLYVFGNIFYFFVFPISIFSRLTEYFVFIEIILVPSMLIFLRRGKKIVLTVYILLFSFLFIKDIDSFLYQREYYSKNILNYKHVTIFNKDEITSEIPKNISQRYFSEN
jgi:hypothetical protein